MPKKKGITQLEFIERYQLPTLLRDAKCWKSLLIDYHPPTVERLYTDYDGWRINLHRIQPCDPKEVLFHPHPWPSQMRVVKGRYRMELGVGSGRKPPKVSSVITLDEGSAYEMMDDPDAWHSVCPLDGEVWSVMITGEPWGRWSPKPPSGQPLSPLSSDRIREMFRFFRRHYPVQEDGGVS